MSYILYPTLKNNAIWHNTMQVSVLRHLTQSDTLTQLWSNGTKWKCWVQHMLQSNLMYEHITCGKHIRAGFLCIFNIRKNMFKVKNNNNINKSQTTDGFHLIKSGLQEVKLTRITQPELNSPLSCGPHENGADSVWLQTPRSWALEEQTHNEKHTVGHSCPATSPQNVAHGHQHLLLS